MGDQRKGPLELFHAKHRESNSQVWRDQQLLWQNPIQIEAPIKKILRRLRGLILIRVSRIRPWPIHVACLTIKNPNDIVNWFAGIAISPLSYYRCRDNLYQVRTIVDYQIRWSAIFTLAHKLKSSARNIIPKYSKDLFI